MKTKIITLLLAAIVIAMTLNAQNVVVLSEVANYIDFQALSVSDTNMTKSTITSVSPYTLANGTVLRGFLKTDGTESANKWNVRPDYNATMPTPEWDGVDSLKAGTAFRAAVGTTIELGAFHTSAVGKLVVYFQPNGDSERGVEVYVNGELAATMTGSGVMIDGIRPAYAGEIDLPAGSYDAGDVVIKLISNTSKIFGIGISRLHGVSIRLIDGISYSLDDESLTAEVTAHVKYTGDINIPSSIVYDNKVFSVTTIGVKAFSGCTGLTAISIPNSVTNIGDYAFSGCSGLTSVTCLGETPARLGNGAFNSCHNLDAIFVPCGTISAYKKSWSTCKSEITHSPDSACMYTIATISANTEWGKTFGDTTALYLEEVPIFAIPNYGYHFIQWNDGNTNNPRTIVVQEDKTYTATFAKNNYSITMLCNSEQGSITSPSQAEYFDSVNLTAIPRRGCNFVRWADGNTDNPRSFILTQDTTFEAIFDYLREGKCGKDSALTWKFNPSSMALEITGKGSLSENYTYGEFIESLTIGNEISVIGQSAFSLFRKLKNVVIGSSVKVLEKEAFTGCSAIKTITCYSQRPPTVNEYALSGLDYSTIVYVPTEYLNTYFMHDAWGLYDVRSLDEKPIPCDPTNDVIHTTICYGDSVSFGNLLLYQSGTYIDSLKSVCGADSIITLVLNVVVPQSVTIMDTIEAGEVYHLGTKEFTQQGIYKDTTYSIGGCDSIITTLLLFVEPVPTYVLNVLSNNTQYGSVKGGGKYAKHSKATLMATPAPECRFIRWSDGNTDNPRIITVMSDSSLTAFFSIIKYNLVAEPNDPMLGSVSGGGEYLRNTKATLMVTPYKGCRFTRWSDGNTLNPRSVSITKDSVFTAVLTTEIPITPPTESDTLYFSAGDSILRAVRIYSSSEIEAYSKLVVATTDNKNVMGGQINHYRQTVSYTPNMKANTIAIIEAVPAENNFRLKTTAGYLTPGGQNRNALYSQTNGADWQFVKYGNVVIPQAIHYNSRMILYNEEAPRFSSYRQVTGLNRYQTTVYKLIAPIVPPQEPEPVTVDSTLMNEYSEVIEDIPTDVTPADTVVYVSTPYVEVVSSFTVIVWADEEHTQCIAIITYTATGQIIAVTRPNAVRRVMKNNDISFEIGGLTPTTQYYYTVMACDDDGSVFQSTDGSFSTTGSTTDIETTNPSDNLGGFRKLLRDGQIFILRGDKTYTLTGQEIK